MNPSDADKDETPTGNQPSKQPPLKPFSPISMIESLMTSLKPSGIVNSTCINDLLRIKKQIKRKYRCSNSQAAMDNAVLASPWLASEAAELTRLRKGVIRATGIVCRLAEQSRHQPCSAALIEALSDLAEKYSEAEFAYESLLHSAYPGPDWAN
ncbi:MAG: hypothetical protein AAFN77_21625 [Planctomycetota bacterium]